MRPEPHLGDLAVEVRERVAELALKATDGGGQPAPHEQTPAYYDQTLGGRIYPGGRDRPANRCPRQPVRDADGCSPRIAAAKRNARCVRRGRVRRAKRCARNGAETYCVSSVLKPQFGNSYGPENLFERADRAPPGWKVRPGQGIGEWITIEFDEPAHRAIRSSVRNGYQKKQRHLRQEQPRAPVADGVLRTAKPDADAAGSFRVRIADTARAAGEGLLDQVHRSTSVCPGNTYTDTAITKLVVNSERAQ